MRPWVPKVLRWVPIKSSRWDRVQGLLFHQFISLSRASYFTPAISFWPGLHFFPSSFLLPPSYRSLSPDYSYSSALSPSHHHGDSDSDSPHKQSQAFSGLKAAVAMLSLAKRSHRMPSGAPPLKTHLSVFAGWLYQWLKHLEIFTLQCEHSILLLKVTRTEAIQWYILKKNTWDINILLHPFQNMLKGLLDKT